MNQSQLSKFGVKLLFSCYFQEACKKCKIPLYTKIAYDEAKRWRSYTPMDNVKLDNDVISLIHALVDRVEKYHGETLVSHALGYITAAKAGLRLAQFCFKGECSNWNVSYV